jgi:hypothetical protein
MANSLWALIIAAFLLPAIPLKAPAQTVVVSNFKGKPKKAVRRIQKAITKALEYNDITVTSLKKYRRQARKMKIKPRVMFKPKSISRIAEKLKIDGVVDGKVRRKKRRFIVVINLLGADGSLLTSMEFIIKKPKLSTKQLGEIIIAVDEYMAQEEESAPAVAEAEEPPEVTETTEATPEIAAESTEAAAPPPPAEEIEPEIAEAPAEETKPETKPLDMNAIKSFMAPRKEETTIQDEIEDDPVVKRSRKKFGAVPDMMLTAGFAFNNRQGLAPRHDSSLVSCLRFDGRFFLGSILDVVVLEDIGFSGMANWALAHDYGSYDPGSPLNATQLQWQAELNYRLDFLNDVALKPAFVIRGGYGSAMSDIDTTAATDSFVHDAAYTFTYVAMDIYLMLLDPILRMHVSGGYLINVWPAKDLRGNGTGFTARAGFDTELFEFLHLGVGYELWNFNDIDLASLQTSDTWQNFYTRLGWSFQ